MVKISLNAYLGDIETKIEEGQIDEALGHCRRILKNYPKHVDSYRLMGKAYLEQKRYSSAGDIFQRVLSSAPDDFVSHVGMSIIREEEKNHDTSIWHMERAFESQPSNRAVQDELRRLYKEREGFAPPKIRLTRGALARMYSHGDLYSQAIGELRAALSEDPNRPDLEVLLAEMYFKTEQKDDAFKVGMQLLKKLPFCLFANLLVAQILIDKGRDKEAQPYLELAMELDPYSTLAADEANTDDEITLDYLVFDSDIDDTREASPEPVQSKTESFAEEKISFEKEELPNWLSGPLEEAAEQNAGGLKDAPQYSISDELLGIEPEEEVELPEDATGLEEEESLSDQLLSPAPEEKDDLAEAATSQEEQTIKPNEEGAPSEREVPGWLQELLPNQESDEKDVQEAATLAENPSDGIDASAEQSVAGEDVGNKTDDPAWLQELTPQQDAAEEDLLAETEESGQESPELASIEPEEETQDASSWLDEIPAEEEPASVEQSVAGEDLDNKTDDPARLQKLTSQQDAAEEALLAETEQSGQESSELASIEPEEETQDASSWLDEIPAEVETRPSDSYLDTEASAPDPADEAISAVGNNETPDWLKDLAEAAERTDQPSRELEIEALAQAPDWLDDLQPETATQKAADPFAAPEPGDSEEESAWIPETSLEAQGTSPEDEGLEFASREEPSPPIRIRRRTSSEAKLEKVTQSLELARQAINFDKLEDALEHYQRILGSRAAMDEMIADLQAALNKHPKHAGLWQTLGDAYMRSDRLRDALECYTKAEDLI